MRYVLTAILLAGLAGSADAASRSVLGKARTWTPISVVNSRALDFGSVIVGATGGNVVVNARTDARTKSGGLVLKAGGTPGAARFTVTGTPSLNTVVTLGARPVLTRSGGAETMNVTALTMNGTTVRRTSAAGAIDLRVGGTLAVAANQRDGLYSGNFSVTVDYQ